MNMVAVVWGLRLTKPSTSPAASAFSRRRFDPHRNTNISAAPKFETQTFPHTGRDPEHEPPKLWFVNEPPRCPNARRPDAVHLILQSMYSLPAALADPSPLKIHNFKTHLAGNPVEIYSTVVFLE